MEKSIKKNDIASYDILKLFLSYLILAINCMNLGLGNAGFYITEYVARLSVPLFFCMSGFFLFQNYNSQSYEKSKEHFKKYELNLLKIYIIWNGIYLLIMIYYWVKDKTPVIEIIKYFWYVFIGIQYQQLWYIGASIVGAFLVWILLKRLSIKKILVISLAFYAAALFFFTYLPLTTELIEKNSGVNLLLFVYNKFFSTFRNGVFFGFPFIAMGACFAICPPKKTPTAAVLPAFIVSMVLLLFETRFLSEISAPYHGLMLFLTAAVPCAFILVGKIKIKASPVYRNIRKISTYIFLDSFISIFVFDEMFFKDSANYLFRYIFCAVFSTALAVLIVFVKNKIHFVRKA